MGAKTIPEGGYHALPDRMHGDEICVVGDSVGLVDVPSLKGIHYSMQSGMYAARAIFEALKKDDVSADGLAGYTAAVRDSYIAEDMPQNHWRYRSARWVAKVHSAVPGLTCRRIFMEQQWRFQ